MYRYNLRHPLLGPRDTCNKRQSKGSIRRGGGGRKSYVPVPAYRYTTLPGTGTVPVLYRYGTRYLYRSTVLVPVPGTVFAKYGSTRTVPVGTRTVYPFDTCVLVRCSLILSSPRAYASHDNMLYVVINSSIAFASFVLPSLGSRRAAKLALEVSESSCCHVELPCSLVECCHCVMMLTCEVCAVLSCLRMKLLALMRSAGTVPATIKPLATSR